MNNILKKYTVFACALVASLASSAQINQIANLSSDKLDANQITAKPVIKSVPVNATLQNVKKGQMSYGHWTRSVASQVETKAAKSNKPGTYYTANKGVYNLVPGFMIAQDNANQPIYANRGILGYIDRDMAFINKTPLCDNFSWNFFNEEYKEDSIMIHPFFANNGYSIDTPILSSTLNGVDSTYQMGSYYDTYNKKDVSGMIALSGLGFIYNVDVDAEPFVNTFYGTTSSTDPWNNILFGNDAESKPYYLEMFDAPAGGAVVLSATHFYVVTPLTGDLTNKEFEVQWWELNDEGTQWVTRKSFRVKPDSYEEYDNLKIRLWTFIATDDNFTTLVDHNYAIMINGPQDGTQWALLHQLDRAQFTDSERNTAYFVPTTGEMKDQLCQYNMGFVEDGELITVSYNTSLDIHQRIVTPYILMCNDDAAMQFIDKSELDFDINGEVRSFILSDWYGYAPFVSLTAKISESTDGDWLTVTQPQSATVGGMNYYFRTTMTATSKDFMVEGRRATVTLTDNMGYSRDIVVYQGDHDAADAALALNEVNASGKVSVTYEGGQFKAVYPESYTLLEVYDMAGACLGHYNLDASGIFNMPASELSKGVYIFQFKGKDMQSVKVLK